MIDHLQDSHRLLVGLPKIIDESQKVMNDIISLLIWSKEVAINPGKLYFKKNVSAFFFGHQKNLN